MQRPIQQKIPLAAVILAVIISFQSVGWLLAWQGLQFEASKEAQRILFQEDGGLEERTFHQINFKKLKIGAKEIRLDGQLLDYRILSETGDSVRVMLYHDQQEQALLSSLGQVFESEHNTNVPSSTPVALWLAKWLGSAFLLPEKPVVSSSVTLGFQRQILPHLLLLRSPRPVFLRHHRRRECLELSRIIVQPQRGFEKFG